MTEDNRMDRFIFYHADRSASLKESQPLELDENGLSYFGRTYWPAFQTKTIEQLSDTQLREFYLEEIKKKPEYHLYASRLQSIFAANSIAEAIVFAESIVPRPDHPIPIIEIYAERFWTLDSNYLDYTSSHQQQINNYHNYWDGRVSNHRPSLGERRPPMLEVMIALPARTGKVVHVVK